MVVTVATSIVSGTFVITMMLYLDEQCVQSAVTISTVVENQT